MQKQMEANLRELSEKINTDTYRYTLVQIFVLGFHINSIGECMANETLEIVLYNKETGLIQIVMNA